MVSPTLLSRPKIDAGSLEKYQRFQDRNAIPLAAGQPVPQHFPARMRCARPAVEHLDTALRGRMQNKVPVL